MSFGTLYLLPCTLGDTPAAHVLPQHVIDLARTLTHFVVEQPKTARQFLSALKHEHPIQSLHFASLNEHTLAKDLDELLQPLLAGHDVGIISEAGCPGIADPGADLVALAHHKGIRVVPLVGTFVDFVGIDGFGLKWAMFRFSRLCPHRRSGTQKDAARP